MRIVWSRLASLVGRRRVVTALVTGSNGKTTTVNMLACILTKAGYRVGKTNTEGIYIRDKQVWSGDSSGFLPAGWVMTEPGITAAVLETARGSIIKRGIFLARSDVAALTNIGLEHIGENGIDTPEQMARLKKRVLDTAQAAVVTNADDRYCNFVASEFPVKKKILFSFDAKSMQIRDHLAQGGSAVCVSASDSKRSINFYRKDHVQEVIDLHHFPASLDGSLRFNVANAMTATALALGLGLSCEQIRSGLIGFSLDADNPGRFTLLTDRKPHIVINYGSNPVALRETMPAIDALPNDGIRYCIITAPDSRMDNHYSLMAQEIANHFDRYLIFIVDRYVRVHQPDWIVNRLRLALFNEGQALSSIRGFSNLDDALGAIDKESAANDLVVVFGETMENALQSIGRQLRPGTNLPIRNL